MSKTIGSLGERMLTAFVPHLTAQATCAGGTVVNDLCVEDGCFWFRNQIRTFVRCPDGHIESWDHGCGSCAD